MTPTMAVRRILGRVVLMNLEAMGAISALTESVVRLHAAGWTWGGYRTDQDDRLRNRREGAASRTLRRPAEEVHEADAPLAVLLEERGGDAAGLVRAGGLSGLRGGLSEMDDDLCLRGGLAFGGGQELEDLVAGHRLDLAKVLLIS